MFRAVTPSSGPIAIASRFTSEPLTVIGADAGPIALSTAPRTKLTAYTNVPLGEPVVPESDAVGAVDGASLVSRSPFATVTSTGAPFDGAETSAVGSTTVKLAVDPTLKPPAESFHLFAARVSFTSPTEKSPFK